MASDTLTAVYEDYAMDPAFTTAARFSKGGGRADADVLFVWNDGPSFDLGKMLLEVGLDLSDVYVTSVLKHNPWHLRQIPTARSYLRREMRLLYPKVICPLGSLALRSFLPTAMPWHLSTGRLERTAAGTPVVAVEKTEDLILAMGLLDDEEFTRRG